MDEQPEKLKGYYFSFRDGGKPIYIETDGETHPMRGHDEIVLCGLSDTVTVNWDAVAYYMPLEMEKPPAKDSAETAALKKVLDDLTQPIGPVPAAELPYGGGQYL